MSELDTYRLIREAITRELAGVGRLLDVGNGGVFEYDTSLVGSIVAVDLFLDSVPGSHFHAQRHRTAGIGARVARPRARATTRCFTRSSTTTSLDAPRAP